MHWRTNHRSSTIFPAFWEFASGLGNIVGEANRWSSEEVRVRWWNDIKLRNAVKLNNQHALKDLPEHFHMNVVRNRRILSRHLYNDNMEKFVPHTHGSTTAKC